MTVQPYNPPDSFLVSSRTEPEVEYLVDLAEMTCGCPGALEFGSSSPDHPCAHVEAAMAFVHQSKPRARAPFTFFVP